MFAATAAMIALAELGSAAAAAHPLASFSDSQRDSSFSADAVFVRFVICFAIVVV